MNTESRLGFTRVQKIVLWIAGLVCLWAYLRRPPIMEALLNFALAGMVPGTTIVLTPDEVLKLVGGILLLLGLCIFRKVINKALASMLGNKMSDATPTYITSARQVLQFSMLSMEQSLQQSPPVKVQDEIQTPGRASTSTRSMLKHQLALMREGTRAIYALILIISNVLAVLAIRSTQEANTLLRATLPHIRKCDRWLEKQTQMLIREAMKKLS